MHANEIFKKRPGRVLHNVRNCEVANVVTVGLRQLSGPLNEYNKAFSQLQRRRRGTPLAGLPEVLVAPGQSNPPLALVRPLLNEAHTYANNLTSSQAVDVPHQHVPSAIALNANSNLEMDSSGAEGGYDDDEDYWRAFDDDQYEPREVFAEDEETPLDEIDM